MTPPRTYQGARLVSAIQFVMRWASAGALVAASGLAVSQPDSTLGRALFLDPGKGNCAACHQVPADPAVKSTSRIGAPLVGIKSQYPDRARLRAIIWDLSTTIPDTIMPPYGRHRILTEAEIDALLRYLDGI